MSKPIHLSARALVPGDRFKFHDKKCMVLCVEDNDNKQSVIRFLVKGSRLQNIIIVPKNCQLKIKPGPFEINFNRK